MVLISFSYPKHIPLILSGQKSQTTRQPRKPRANGTKPYSVNEKVQLYYRSRQKKTCGNCIVGQPCNFHQTHGRLVNETYDRCASHSNFFGEAVITEINHYWSRPLEISEGFEYWMGSTLGHLDDEEQDLWAVLDGFKNFDEAHDFFYAETADAEWAYKDLDVIKWDGTQIVGRVA